MATRGYLSVWRVLLVAGLAVWAVALGTAGDSPQEKEFAPKEGGFSLTFPSETTSGTAGSGASQFKTERVKRSAVGALGYTLYWRLREKPFDTPAAAEAYLKAQQEGVAASGKLVSEGEINLDGGKGREFIVTVNESTTLRCRAFVVEKLICMLMVQGQGMKAVTSDDAERFFKSFKLTGGKKR
jgi:hypothetical protein